MNSLDFNFHVKRACADKKSLDEIYSYCLGVIKIHINCKYGKNFFDATVPHDIITKVIIEHPPTKPITNPVSWLCRITDNYIISVFKRKDNQTVELTEDYGYDPEYEVESGFSSEELKKAWDSLDETSKYIVYLNVYQNYRLNEIAVMLEKRADYVRTKKSRALKVLRKAIKENDKNCRFIKR